MTLPRIIESPPALVIRTAPSSPMATQNQSGSQDLGGIAGWAVSIMEAIGAPGAGLLVALENLFPPIPSEVILPLAGFTASQGNISLVGAILWTTVGSVVGAIALYWLGAALGRDRLRVIVDKLPLVDLHDLDRTENWFNRHGKSTVFFGRMVPVFRSLISIPAGVERMSLWLFVLLTAAGSLIWNSLFVLAGYFLGQNWQVAQRFAGIFSRVVLGAIVVIVLWWVLKRLRRNRKAA